MVQHHDSVPSLNCTAISIDSPHMHRDGANYLNLLLLSFLVYVVGYGNGCGYVPTSNGGRGCFLDDDGSHRGTSPSLILLTKSHRRSGKPCETRIENGCFISQF